MTLFRRIAIDGCMLSGKCLKGVPYIYLVLRYIALIFLHIIDLKLLCIWCNVQASWKTPMLFIDDLYVTGILRQRLTFGLIDLQPIAYRKCTFFNVFLLPYFSLLANPHQEELLNSQK